MEFKESQSGTLKVSEDVIATIVRTVIGDIDGVDGLAPAKPSVKRLFIKNKTEDSVKIKLNGDVVEITVSVIAKLGCKVHHMAEQIQERVKSDVQSMTGIAVSKVNVVVAGLSLDTKQ